MITTILQGGMGNQMFQYAMGLQQARILNVKLGLDATRLGGKRPFNLGQWSYTDLILTTRKEPSVIENGMSFNANLYHSIKDGDVIQGYWQNEKYFAGGIENELRKIFTPFVPLSERAQKIKDQIEGSESVAVHVRRGDYLLEPHKSFHGVLSNEYYSEAVSRVWDLVGLHAQFFIFSDDLAWAREYFSDKTTKIIEPGRESEDIYLMSLCKHAVIANSSFSWWGAWLGDKERNRIVIAPEKWFDQGNEDYSDIVPKRWIKI